MSEKIYPRVVIDLKKLRNNIDAIIGRCNDMGIDVAGVTKCVSSLPEVARQFEEGGAKFIASSRINQLQRLKDAGIKTPLMLIRSPMLSEVEKTVELADVSLVSEVPLIGALDRAAQKAGRKMMGKSPGFFRAAARVWGFSRDKTGNSRSLSCGAREVQSPFEL